MKNKCFESFGWNQNESLNYQLAHFFSELWGQQLKYRSGWWLVSNIGKQLFRIRIISLNHIFFPTKRVFFWEFWDALTHVDTKTASPQGDELVSFDHLVHLVPDGTFGLGGSGSKMVSSTKKN